MRTLYLITAYTLAFFLALSTARGLVPGLCQNLVSPPSDSAMTGPIFSPMRSCCARGTGAPSGENTPPSNKETSCAFCKVAKALVEVPAVVQVPVPPETVYAVPAALPTSPYLAIRSLPDKRGPPPPPFAWV